MCLPLCIMILSALLNVSRSLREQTLQLQIGYLVSVSHHCTSHVFCTAHVAFPLICFFLPFCSRSGCVLYEMCTLKHAFDAHNLLGLVWKIVSESYPPIPEHYSADLKELVATMLSKDPQGRPSIDAILELPFIRARLHSQIRAKMSLKSNGGKPGTSAGRRPPTSAGSGGEKQQQTNGEKSTPSAQQQASSQQQQQQKNLGGTVAGGAGPTGTLRQRPTVEVSTAPTGGAVERLASPGGFAPNPSPSPTHHHSNSAVLPSGSPPSGRATSASSRAVGGARSTSSAAGGPLASPSSGSTPLLSPSDRLALRKQQEADARARELTEAVRTGGFGSRQGARPGSGAPHGGPYSSGFEEDNGGGGGGMPPRQRSASSRADPNSAQQQQSTNGSYSGRTPTRSNPSFDYPPPSSPSPSSFGGVGGDERPIKSSGGYQYAAPQSTGSPRTTGNLDDRPIKSSGSYRIATNAPVLSPAAQQALRAQQSSTASTITSTPPSSGSQTRFPDDPYARPNSVSSSRVTRVQDDEDDLGRGSAGVGEDSYSEDDFDPLSDDEEEIVQVLERTYTGHQANLGSSGSSAGSANRSPVPAGRPLSSTPASTAANAVRAAGPSNIRAQSSSTAASPNVAASPTSSGSTIGPSMSSKHATIKKQLLRSMSEQEFDEVFNFIRKRTLEARTRSDGSKDLTKEELAMKFGQKNQQIVFQIEQLVFLSDLLENGRIAGGGGTSSSATPSAAKPSPESPAPKRASLSGPSSASVKSPSKPPSTTAPKTPVSGTKPTSAAASRIKK